MTFGGAAPSVASASAMIMHMRIEIGAKVEEDDRSVNACIAQTEQVPANAMRDPGLSCFHWVFRRFLKLILPRIFENFR